MQPGIPHQNLGLVFQEVLTAIERVRAKRQKVANAESFRTDIRQMLVEANQEGRKHGYSPEDIRLAMFAVIAFLDESILNSRLPMFADWSRKPLQQEIFGGHQAGEIYFQNIDKLLQQSDSTVLADVLEVYLLCLLLGYGGKYSVMGRGELRSIGESMAERIRRIRGGGTDLSPSWAPPKGAVVRPLADQWIRRLAIAAAAAFCLSLLLFVIFKISLNSGASALQ
jgi:type VI secretion system protein ImpK